MGFPSDFTLKVKYPLKIAEEYEVPIDENLKDFIYYDEFEVLEN